VAERFTPVMEARDIEAFIDAHFPQVHMDGRVLSVRSVQPGAVTVRLDPNDRHLRPGGTISGPTLFTISDLAAYYVILAHIGPVALVVTTNLNINFVHRAAPGPLTCEASLLKLGKRLAVAEVSVRDEDGTLVSHATATYSIPPRKPDTVK